MLKHQDDQPGKLANDGFQERDASRSMQRTELALYSSYFLAAWAWRGMEFTIALVLIQLYPDSLLLISVYGMLDNACRVLLGGVMGAYIDRAERWQGARNCYILQNTCVAGAGLGMAVVLSGLVGQPGALDTNEKVPYWALVSASLLFSSGSTIGSTGVMIAVEKNMPKQLCGGDSVALSKMNSVFRAIDLVCLLASPILSGCLMTFYSPLSAVLLLGGYCLLAWAPELSLLQSAFKMSASLSAPKVRPPPTSEDINNSGGGKKARKAGGWSVYCRQTVLLANISLAALYMTVLSLGFLMTSYLKWSGLTEAEVSLYRGMGAITGLLATVVYPFLRQKIGLIRCGLLGISYQMVCLGVGVLPVVYFTLGWDFLGRESEPSAGSRGLKEAHSSLAFERLLIGGVVASRTGLWLFDLAVTQLVQEQVLPHELGVVCGVQSSLQACFETASFLAGTFCTDPMQFWVLMLASWGVVCCSMLLYVVFMLRFGEVGTAAEEQVYEALLADEVPVMDEDPDVEH